MRESIFFASIRSFFVAFFGIAGVCIGFVLILALINSISTSTELDNTPTYTPEIVPNAKGVRKEQNNDAPVILKLNIRGVIGLDSLNMHSIRQQLVESREGVLKGDRVKALIVHIETPGGTVVDADGIYQAIKAYKTEYKVPVYAYVDGLCASGGMYVAAACDKIFASDVSLIGSVGVISPAFVNVSKLLETIGVQSLTLAAGKGKDDLNPLRPWRPGEDENFKAIINYYYEQFVNLVASNRPEMNKEKLIKDYGANIYPASKAKDLGYIDVSGISFNETLKLLVEKIGIQDDYYQVVQLEKKSWYTELFSSQAKLLNGEIKHRVVLPNELPAELSNQYLYLYKP